MEAGRVRLTGLRRWSRERTARLIRRGHRTVIWTPEGLGFGNFLYLWLRAHTLQLRGQDFRVLYVPEMEPWLAQLPEIRQRLVIRLDEVRVWDRRDRSWNQRFGVDFTRDELHRFIRDHLAISQLVGPPQEASRTVTVNIRRGDYYATPELRRRYGFDIAGYLDKALPAAERIGGPIEGIEVVSDGVDWCRQQLDEVLKRYTCAVDYIPSTESAQSNFHRVSTAQRLVGTNSTFSYWAGYVGNVLYGPDSHVVMPGFHARHIDGGRAFQLDPDWEIIHDIPGGWDG